jgi:hypothetical protein
MVLSERGVLFELIAALRGQTSTRTLDTIYRHPSARPSTSSTASSEAERARSPDLVKRSEGNFPDGLSPHVT